MLCCSLKLQHRCGQCRGITLVEFSTHLQVVDGVVLVGPGKERRGMDESFALPSQLVAVSVPATCTAATARPLADLSDNCRPVAV